MSGVILYPVESSVMSHIGYDPASKTLTILFDGSKRYEYAGVEQEVFDRFMAADSKGHFFNENIDGHYSYAQVKGRDKR